MQYKGPWYQLYLEKNTKDPQIVHSINAHGLDG